MKKLKTIALSGALFASVLAMGNVAAVPAQADSATAQANTAPYTLKNNTNKKLTVKPYYYEKEGPNKGWKHIKNLSVDTEKTTTFPEKYENRKFHHVKILEPGLLVATKFNKEKFKNNAITIKKVSNKKYSGKKAKELYFLINNTNKKLTVKPYYKSNRGWRHIKNLSIEARKTIVFPKKHDDRGFHHIDILEQGQNKASVSFNKQNFNSSKDAISIEKVKELIAE